MYPRPVVTEAESSLQAEFFPGRCPSPGAFPRPDNMIRGLSLTSSTKR